MFQLIITRQITLFVPGFLWITTRTSQQILNRLLLLSMSSIGIVRVMTSNHEINCTVNQLPYHKEHKYSADLLEHVSHVKRETTSNRYKLDFMTRCTKTSPYAFQLTTLHGLGQMTVITDNAQSHAIWLSTLLGTLLENMVTVLDPWGQELVIYAMDRFPGKLV